MLQWRNWSNTITSDYGAVTLYILSINEESQNLQNFLQFILLHFKFILRNGPLGLSAMGLMCEILFTANVGADDVYGSTAVRPDQI